MVSKYWTFTLKNEFAQSILERQVPRLLGVEVSYDRLTASVTSTKELVNKMWSSLSRFEESCATALSGMLLHATKPDPLKALSASSHFLVKVEGLCRALDSLVEDLESTKTTCKSQAPYGRLEIDKRTGLSIVNSQKVVYKTLMAYFSLLTKPVATGSERTKVFLRYIESMASGMKNLVKVGLGSTERFERYAPNRHSIVLSFLVTVENATSFDARQGLRQNTFIGLDADICSLCQSHVTIKAGQGCYRTKAQLHHIDCIICRSCDSLPKLIYPTSGNPYTQYRVSGNPYPQCSRCAHGDMMDMVSQRIGEDFTIIHSELLLNVHVLWIAWRRIATLLQPRTNPGE
jgi:hypothetical protein